MFQKNYLAIVVASACSVISAYAEESQPVALPEISVVAQVDSSSANVTQITKKVIERKQPRDLKALFADQLDINVNDLQGSRTGNDGVNIRGLQGNRVAMSIDGIPLPEGQENKVFRSYGQDFGAGNSIEPTALRSAKVQYSGSQRSLSGSVSFATLEPKDLISSGNVGGFIASGYNSVDNAIYGSVGGAAKNERYSGLVIATGRFGHETENNASIGGEGTKRTKANPADYKNSYVLVKNSYQVNDNNEIKLTFEHQQKITDTELASTQGADSSRHQTGRPPVNPQIVGFTEDKTRRARVSLAHNYQSDKSWLNEVQTHLYYQNALTENYRHRQFARGARNESGIIKNQTLGLSSDFTTFIDSTISQVLRYGFSYEFSRLKNDIVCDVCNKSSTSTFIFDPLADTKQHKTHFYIEDEFTFGNVTLTPHLGVLNYRFTPSKANYKQAASEFVNVEGQNHTVFLPKFNAQWNIIDEFTPYFQYSRGVRTPSSQQLTSSFGHTISMRDRTFQYGVIGNPTLRPEIADNFSLGFKGKSDIVKYNIAGYYNKYRDFIDTTSRKAVYKGSVYNPLIQYHNLEKAKIYGVTADIKVNVYTDFFVSGGVAYSKGSAESKGEKFPINTVQPLKLKAGLGYEGAYFGADISLTHTRMKKDRDINGEVYNPTSSVNIVDLGLYWKPINRLMLSANVNNVFDKKYWNWADISHFAIQKAAGAVGDATLSLNPENADRYTAPGRHFNVGVRYEF